MLVTLDGSLDHLRRPESFFSNGTRQTGAFSENRVTVTGFAEYRTSDTFGINTTLRYSGALTDQRIPVESDPALAVLPYDDFAFNRFEAWLGVRWFFIPQAVMLDGERGRSALRQSAEVVGRGRRWLRVAGIGLFLIIIGAAPGPLVTRATPRPPVLRARPSAA